jgi:steroid delta-isomerase-like uncharacterized protein
MVTTSLTKLTQEFMTAYNSHDIEKIISLSTNDFTNEDVGAGIVYHGLLEERKYFSNLFTAFPDAKMEIKTDFRSGDWGAMEWVMTGTHKGTLAGSGSMPDIPATGKKVTIKGATINQYRGDKVTRGTDYWNMASFMQQLGLMPPVSAK